MSPLRRKTIELLRFGFEMIAGKEFGGDEAEAGARGEAGVQ
jgi:hypothetical protein